MANLYTQYAKKTESKISENDKKSYAYLERQERKGQEEMDDLLAGETNYQVFYNLSDLRTGIISWYDFQKNACVLEIGAGFGAITGYLCSKCAHVTVTERSLYRARAITRRYNSADNLDVYAGDVSDMDFPRQFDVILLIGLLERIGHGNTTLEPYVSYLKGLRHFLKPDGKFLIAVENRFGLRYICGTPEPHTNRAFDGLNGYRGGTSGISFSRKEMEDIAHESGMPYVKFYYPLPDYKFPQLIYTDKYLPGRNLRERLIPYYRRNDTLVASEKELYHDVTENGVFPFFANSFFLECARQENLGEITYAAVSTDRGKRRGYTTTVHTDGKVRKTPLFQEGCFSAKKLYHNICELEKRGIPVVPYRQRPDGSLEMPYIEYPTLSDYIKEIVRKGVARKETIGKDTEEFIELIEKLYQYILQSSEKSERNALAERWPGTKEIDFGPLLKRAYIELIPLNCFYCPKKKEFLYFDQEFMRENYPAKYVLFRAIHYIYCFTPDMERYYSKKKLIRQYDMEEVWEIYRQEEQRFLGEVRNHGRYRQFYQWAKVDYKRIRDNSRRLESEEELIANYRVSDKMKQVWKIELAMLDEVGRICKKHNLTYYLVHGSLLGAIRHQGFIPWDDDLDIAMPRKDYDRFLELAVRELEEPLSIHTCLTEPDLFWGGGARIRNSQTAGIEKKDFTHKGNLGIWIDILPMDVCTMDERKFGKKQKRIRHIQRLLYAKIYGKEFSDFGDLSKTGWKMYRFLSGLYSHRTLCRRLDAAMRLYTEEESEDVSFFTGYYKHRRLYGKDFRDVVYLDFAHRQVPVPVGYENYMFMTMGKDYLKYPPEEERKPKHKGIFNPWKPYEIYQQRFCGIFQGVEGRRLVLFGSGMMFEHYMEHYGQKYKPDFLADNDENKWGRKCMGIEIKSPKEILTIPEGERKVIICSYYYKEIEKQFEKMGIREYCIYVQKWEWVWKAEEEAYNNLNNGK